MNYPEAAIRRSFIYVLIAAMVIGIVQVGIIAWPPAAGNGITGSWRLSLGLFLLLLLATVFLMARVRRLRRAEARIWLTPGLDRLVFEHSPVGMLLSAADGRVRSVNSAYTRLTGFTEHELLGRLDDFQRAGSLGGSLTDAMNASLDSAGYWKGEVWVRKPSGEALGFKITRIALVDGTQSIQGYLTLCQDTAVGSDTERLMLWQAHHDTLTKLPNANLFQERLNRFLVAQYADLNASVGRQGEDPVFVDGAVLSVNLDGFTQVNDSMGFVAGDKVLMESGHRLAMAVRESDTVARVGGDQFAVLLSGLSDETELSSLAGAVVDAMAGAFLIRGKELFVTASVGVNSLPGAKMTQLRTPGDVMRRADSACAQARQSGGNRAVFYEPEMNELAQARYELEASLRRALPDGQLELYYQPLIDQFRQEVVAFEALLRWHHPERGFVSPADFIPLAEETGLIVDIGVWIVKQALERLRSWAAAGYSDLRLSINISTRQLRDDADVAALLAALEAPETRRLTLEITESLLIADKDLYRSFLAQARKLGAKIALDDFGTGYSSLSYLRDYGFDVLKIDRSFVSMLCRDQANGQADRNLVASIISLGKILDLEVVAEGVEEAAELAVLAELGCALIQGYYYSPPMPAAAAQVYLRRASATGVLRALEQSRSTAG